MKFQFNVDEDVARIVEEAEAYRKEYKERGQFRSGVPVTFLGDGTYIFRIYPDRDSKGFVRLIKRAWIHQKIIIEGDRKLRFWKDERVDKLFVEAEEAGLEKIWGKFLYQYKSREQGYMMAHFFECPESEYTKPGNSYGTVLDRRQIFAIQDFIADLHPEDKRTMLDPNQAAPGIKLSITRGSGKANCSCGMAGSQKLELPELNFKDDDGTVIEYTGLDNVYITEEDHITDEDYYKLRNAVYEEISNFKAAGGLAKDRSSEGYKFDRKSDERIASSVSQTQPQPQPQPQQQATPQQTQPQMNGNGSVAVASSAAADEIECRLAIQCKNNPKMAEAYRGAAFGNKPARSNPYCLACDFEEQCGIVTEKNKKAA
jgi:hypothetical protein